LLDIIQSKDTTEMKNFLLKIRKNIN